ncbi:MAG: hypothetical protein WCA20_00045 [Candidatus Sulfotelmatobacter sp.]
MATKQEIRDYFAKFGKQGGKATARNRTAEERSDAARKAVQARWAKDKKVIERAIRQMKENLDPPDRPAEQRATKKKKKASK